MAESSTEITTRRPLAAITGASSGIGAEFARQLAARGYDLLLASRDAGRLESTARELRDSAGVDVRILAVDLSADEGISHLEAAIVESPDLEILINNAGFLSHGDLAESDLDDLRRMNTLQMEAPMRLCRAAVPGMLRRDRGSIVNVSSIAGMAASPGNINYCATKAYLTHFSEGLQLEMNLAGKNVRVQALCPGMTRTELHARAGREPRDVPESLWLTPEEVVSCSLKMLRTSKVVVVPGRSYRFLAAIFRLIPRSWLAFMVEKEQRVLRKRRAADSARW